MYNRLLPGQKGLAVEFIQGVETFIQVASQLSSFQFDKMFRCPCSKHKNLAFLNPDDVKLDLYRRGFVPNYWIWTSHGEYESHRDAHDGSSIAYETFDEDQMSRPYEDLIFDVAGLQALAWGPMRKVRTWPIYIVNGFRFHTKSWSERRKTENCGVCVGGNTHEEDEYDYYGILNEVLDLEYPGKDENFVCLFNCQWYDPVQNRGIRIHPAYGLVDMALGDDPPRKSFASKFRRKKFTISRATQPDEGEGPSVPPADLPTPPPPLRSQQQSLSEQGQGPSNPLIIVPPYFSGHFPPPSTSPHFPSPDQTHAFPFYPYYPPPSSQAASPSIGPHPPYPYPYYYPYPVQHEQGGPSRPPEVGASDHVAAIDKRQYIEPEGDK
ncbi:hypothetical protein KFK09_014284 [Dendrobium nobile]|uniref:Transposase-associated domain-containing protein n=1 Tax=Dendrobium nobile TaxID=94219 RepID=A0A8T3B9I3_DENNO|nr:hypothetical protein KFK09_014284 [Dendrobium nobile]